MPSESAVAVAPQRVGKYEIKRVLGEGATSKVYLCYDDFAKQIGRAHV